MDRIGATGEAVPIVSRWLLRLGDGHEEVHCSILSSSVCA